VSGDIVVYSSGDRVAHEACAPLFTDFARAVYFLGAFGQGMKMKLVANHLVAILNVAAAEAIDLADRAGLDLGEMLDVVSAGAAGFRLLELRGPMMVQGDYTPAQMKLAVWEKDMALIENFAGELGAATPLFDATRVLYSAALNEGRGDEDTAAVREMLRQRSRPYSSE
jgi:3-hydroxyisobutyrate dehydrogenase-like beta-hydroxyacid dehydrogenase